MSSQEVGEKPILCHFVVADLGEVEHERLKPGATVRKQPEHGVHHMLTLLQAGGGREDENPFFFFQGGIKTYFKDKSKR